jgi:hypothetical protein
MEALFANGFPNGGNINASEYFTRLNNLLSNIELILKKCSKKYRDKCEVENLYTDLMVINLCFKKIFKKTKYKYLVYYYYINFFNFFFCKL